MLGLFDTIRKSNEVKKKAVWSQALTPTIVTLNDDHLILETSTTSKVVFYRDIVEVGQFNHHVNIRTLGKTYTLAHRKRSNEMAESLQGELLRRISQFK